MTSEGNKNGWAEYSRLVLSKLDELHNDHKEIKKALEVVNDRLTKLEAGRDDVKDLEDWRDRVNETWSPRQMKEAKDEVYKQKEKWTGVWFIFIAFQVLWGLALAFKDKLLD